MKIFLDTNVVIDLLAKRTNFYQDAIILFDSRQSIFVSTITILDTLYILENQYKIKDARKILNILISKLSILPTFENNIKTAFNSDFSDIEDAVQHFTALEQGNIDYIITRDTKGFSKSKIPVLTPYQFIKKHLKK